MIKINDVSLKIRKAVILKHISLKLEEGRIHGLIGRNGSGKTMLMKCICGFVYPTEGSIEIDGKYIGKDLDFPGNTGIIIETPGFIPYLNGLDNLKILAGCRKKITSEQIGLTMEQMGLDPESRLHVRKYSLGMRQRLGIAQAIMEDPDLLVLDEPFNGLDEDGVLLVRSVLKEKREQGKTIILSSHNSEDIRLLCDSVYRLYKGEIIDRGL